MTVHLRAIEAERLQLTCDMKVHQLSEARDRHTGLEIGSIVGTVKRLFDLRERPLDAGVSIELYETTEPLPSRSIERTAIVEENASNQHGARKAPEGDGVKLAKTLV